MGARLTESVNVPLTILHAGRDETARAPIPCDPGRRRGLGVGDLGRQVTDRVSGRIGALLVIEAHGGGPPGGRLFDADAEHVLQRLGQPVLVLGPHAEMPSGPAVLVVPVDAAVFGDVVMSVVDQWTQTFGAASVVVVSVEAPDRWPSEG